LVIFLKIFQPTIDYILQLHNEIRSKIAQGRCQQPKAGCMKTLVKFLAKKVSIKGDIYLSFLNFQQWDPELARVAQKWADQVNIWAP